jgi:hypothetical protein
MKELKTLKDLNLFNDDLKDDIAKLKLKQEAIKWVKTSDERFEDRIEFKTGVLWFCLNFFNLTEEDWKGEKKE